MGRESAIFEDMTVCMVCKKPNPQIHHIFEGVANRRISDKYDYIAPLCMEHHTGREGVHNNKAFELYLKRKAQSHFEETHTREEFIETFGKSWL